MFGTPIASVEMGFSACLEAVIMYNLRQNTQVINLAQYDVAPIENSPIVIANNIPYVIARARPSMFEETVKRKDVYQAVRQFAYPADVDAILGSISKVFPVSEWPELPVVSTAEFIYNHFLKERNTIKSAMWQ